MRSWLLGGRHDNQLSALNAYKEDTEIARSVPEEVSRKSSLVREADAGHPQLTVKTTSVSPSGVFMVRSACLDRTGVSFFSVHFLCACF